VALYLNLSNSSEFTGHCWRRTGATILAEAGGTVIQLQQAGGWSSVSVAEGYVNESSVSKSIISSAFHSPGVPLNNIAASLSSTPPQNEKPASYSSTINIDMKVDMSNSSNCVVNIYTPNLSGSLQMELKKTE
jgi:hypothetical protein